MKIAILGKGFIDWGGGIDFLKSCINSLKNKEDVELFLFLPQQCGAINEIKDILRTYKDMLVNLLKNKEVGCKNNLQAISQVFVQEDTDLQVIIYKDSLNGLIEKSKELGIEVIIPSFKSLGKEFPIPWVGYIYDFQHKYYSEFFTVEEIRNRDNDFSIMLNKAKVVIVNAYDVKNDINKYFPNSHAKIFNLPFTPMPRKEWFSSEKTSLDKYKLPKKYFMISNQFWVHKSHITAFAALALLHKAGYDDYEIVCSGNTNDYRFPEYFSDLRVQIKKLGIEDKIKFLGYIPKVDQIGIMCDAVAVLQPTLFEGGPGGGATYDAVSMGIPAIISDIAVNKEIENERVFFFKVKSAENMAAKMIQVIKKRDNHEFPQLNTYDLQRMGDNKASNLGERLLEAIQFAKA